MKKPNPGRPTFPGKNPVKKICDERGVSPVIAVILMVAITVVLAAVLYVMVINLIDPQQENITLSMTWEDTGDAAGTYTGYIIKISGKNPNVEESTVTIKSGKNVGSQTLDVLKTADNFTVGVIVMNYYDVNQDDKLGPEDIFTISGVSQGDLVRLTHKDAGEMSSKTF
jgi:flagellin-like protein